jgi:hypothetical protein
VCVCVKPTSTAASQWRSLHTCIINLWFFLKKEFQHIWSYGWKDIFSKAIRRRQTFRQLHLDVSFTTFFPLSYALGFIFHEYAIEEEDSNSPRHKTKYREKQTNFVGSFLKKCLFQSPDRWWQFRNASAEKKVLDKNMKSISLQSFVLFQVLCAFFKLPAGKTW